MPNTVIENLNLLFSEMKVLTDADKVPNNRILIGDQQNIVTKKAFQDVKSSIMADFTGTLTLIKASGFEVKQNLYPEHDFGIVQVMNKTVCIYFTIHGPNSQAVEPKYPILPRTL